MKQKLTAQNINEATKTSQLQKIFSAGKNNAGWIMSVDKEGQSQIRDAAASPQRSGCIIAWM